MSRTSKPPLLEIVAGSKATVQGRRQAAATEEARKARTKAYKKAWAAKNAERARAANLSWRAANPDKVREHKRRSNEKHREKRLEYARQYREQHGEALRAADREAYWRDPEASRARDRERQAGRRPADPVKAREKGRVRYRIKKAERLLTASADERRRASEASRALLAAIKNAVPKSWPFYDDVVGDVSMALFACKITLADLPSAIEKCGRRYRNEEYETLSLDVPAYEGGPSRVDLLVGHNPLEEDDPADDE